MDRASVMYQVSVLDWACDGSGLSDGSDLSDRSDFSDGSGLSDGSGISDGLGLTDGLGLMIEQALVMDRASVLDQASMLGWVSVSVDHQANSTESGCQLTFGSAFKKPACGWLHRCHGHSSSSGPINSHSWTLQDVLVFIGSDPVRLLALQTCK
ncbi:hypothetical protein chiPu_0016915 [Chiloscyllium punctatum]|uniref:Uncharacterized protein n=1 Tax=Chiloscyllium punctatum TaxID=137246 RepID=A0A401T6V7_CHIPU|nr:hypothetical protein [Chiloscyllium punctatum]